MVRTRLLIAPSVVVAVLLAVALALYITPFGGCNTTGEGYAVYVHVVSDGSSGPVDGAKLTGSVSDVCPEAGGSSYTYPRPIRALVTPTNGTVSLPPDWTEYSITIQYSSQTYTFTAQIAPTHVLNATLSVPSGAVSVTSANP
ncbi:MAG: hypothetical protein ABSF83_08035 [Nitrososphaerales archaeon]